MLEVLITFVFTILIVWAAYLWLKVVFLVLLLVLIFPGVYAMVKGAPFVPSMNSAINGMLKLGKFKKTDRVVDIGCGDGKVIRRIAKEKVKEAVGYELSIPTFLLARFRTFLAKGDEKIRFANFWHQDLAQYDVIVCFLLIEAMTNFEKDVWPKLRKGTRVISNAFKLRSVPVEAESDGVYLYVKK